MEIIITGAAGFIGSHIARAFAKDRPGYWKIYGVEDWQQDNRWQNVHDVPIRWITYDNLERTRAQIIIHCAWLADTRGKMDQFEIDLECTNKLLLHSDRADARMIFLSSASIYGDGSPDVGRFGSETAAPLNAYGWSKWQAENAIRATPIKSTILRLFNVYGPHEYHKGPQASVPFHLYNKMVAGKGIELFKGSNPDRDGKQARDFVYVSDVASVVHWAVREGITGTFDVGTGRARTFNELAKICAGLCDYDGEIRYIPMPKDVARHYQEWTQADLGPLHAALYPDPFTSLEDGLKCYFEKYLLPRDLFEHR